MTSVECNPFFEVRDYDFLVGKLRAFFKSKGFLETHVQHRLDILAACEDPSTISTFKFPVGGTVYEYPLPQTGQMRLEQDLLRDPTLPGIFCFTTSYRAEPNPVLGRHDTRFPLIEFEAPGTFDNLLNICRELMSYLGLSDNCPSFDYQSLCMKFGVKELDHSHEAKLEELYGPVTFITHFPEHTSPFFNMKVNEKNTLLSNKLDVIIGGMETIGSAERETDQDIMRSRFHTISDGQYSQTLYAKFGKQRVDDELDAFLSHKFIPRYGGGIGFTRLLKAMKKYKLM